jgi:hypothetical protein
MRIASRRRRRNAGVRRGCGARYEIDPLRFVEPPKYVLVIIQDADAAGRELVENAPPPSIQDKEMIGRPLGKQVLMPHPGVDERDHPEQSTLRLQKPRHLQSDHATQRPTGEMYHPDVAASDQSACVGFGDAVDRGGSVVQLIWTRRPKAVDRSVVGQASGQGAIATDRAAHRVHEKQRRLRAVGAQRLAKEGGPQDRGHREARTAVPRSDSAAFSSIEIVWILPLYDAATNSPFRRPAAMQEIPEADGRRNLAQVLVRVSKIATLPP